MKQQANLAESDSWAQSVGSLLQRGPWLEKHKLSAESVVLTLKGLGSAQKEGDKAAHQVKFRHVLMALKNMGDDKDAWRELFNYVYC